MPVEPYLVARLLGGERVLGRRVRTLDQLRRAVEAGLPVAALARVAEHVAGYAAAAELKYGIVPKATLHRRRTRLSPEESERLERLARVTAMAESVWEDRALAHEFLTSPQPQLGGARPVELARSDLGSRQVEQLLNGLEYALPA
jgi:putative toxin-antitoxin system antitoxin component (TIGR02293 family)